VQVVGCLTLYLIFLHAIKMKIFVLRGTRKKGMWMNLDSEELHGCHSSPNLIRVDKSRRMRWAANVARMGDIRCAYRVSMGEI